jgi:uncharacterized membrane protein YkoI
MALTGCTDDAGPGGETTSVPPTNEPSTVATTNAPEPDPADFISQEEAIRIALEQAQLTEDKVVNLRVRERSDDGVTEYEVDFDYGNFDYDYDINAITGEIRDIDIDPIHETEE